MFKVITFDIYSASLDINGSAIPKVEKILEKSKAFSTDFFKTWRAQQWNFLLLNNSMNDEFKNYDYITNQVLDYTCHKFDIEISESQRRDLMAIWTSFKAWPEAKLVIDEIKARGYKVAMLSNGDEAMLSPLQESTGIEFDAIFSGDQAQCYKPDPKIYQNAISRLGVDAGHVLHVAGSLFDVMGAKAAGLTCAWSNRYSDRVLDLRFSPDYNLSSLKDLLAILPKVNTENL